ncbi:exodeoxyribonuclease VII large subunit [Aggregicoccus sp. 17bor-14]|uniref:exodeoxyribonuclease VII large subunit n=1 Tax=Myxococcaceae TaxID=31 RepID=UPI00129D0978|nr:MULTISPECIES: exodeoxyribonuclease VII large subunit [Myxococcaceae]MBF5045561.1 exodeoxyribonuclease VII large subunit [Simulacricoccus sp. 17bor-14]MRI91298.1 exodeoxyribonuclease VII large subunit [Aggregicoccus sp. 17bor-14]
MTKRKGAPEAPPQSPLQQADLFGTALPKSAPPTRAGAVRPAAERAPAPPPAPAPAQEVSQPLAPLAGSPAASAPNGAAKAARTVLTVGELTRQIKNTLETKYTRVIVRGEVSSFRGANARGHLYFTMKDAGASIDAKLWASQAARLRFALRDGLAVVAEGSVDLYEPQGRYSLIVSRLEPEGEGALALAFEQLKERLAAEGLIGDRRIRPPRPVPFLPRRIGVVTSRTGAALQDFLRVLHSRHPRLPVLVCDARVQGEGSAEEVARGIERLARTDVDVIVVTRGGGSVEDLWTFNEERVARAIHASPVPVVSAIGHEIDFTIADFVADLRAPTPSAAAERLAPVLADLQFTLATQEARLRQAATRRVLELRGGLSAQSGRLVDPRRQLGQQRLHLSEQLERAMRVLRPSLRQRRAGLQALDERLQRAAPQARLAEQRQRLLKLHARLTEALRAQLSAQRAQLTGDRLRLERASPAALVAAQRTALLDRRARLLAGERLAQGQAQAHFQRLAARLDAMSPLKVMSRGYAVAFRKADGRVVRSMADVQVGDALGVKFANGGARTLGACEEIEATVTALSGPGDC